MVAGGVSVERLRVAAVEARDVTASLRLDEQALALTDVAATMLGGRLRGDLTVPAGQRAMAVQVDAVSGVGTAIQAGDYVDLRAEMDVLVALSNCPQVNNPANDYNPTPIRVIVRPQEASA